MSQKQSNVLNTQQIKTQIQNLSNARQSIQKSKDISGSMLKLSTTMNSLQPLLSKQSQYIKNFLQTQSSSGQSPQQSQIRRYTNRIYDIAIGEITELILEGKQYFTLNIKSNWKKIANDIQKDFLIQKDKIQTYNQLIQFLFKINNTKDKFIKDFLKSILYHLAITQQGFVHSQKKTLNKMIQTYQLTKNYVPPRPEFQDSAYNIQTIQGAWNLSKLQNDSCSVAQIFKILNNQFQQIFSIIRNYANLNQQQRNKEQIKRNDQQVISLRQKIQQMTKNYQLLQKKYRQSLGKDQKMDITDLRQKLKQAEDNMQLKDLQIKQLKFEFRDSSTHIQTLKQKIHQLSADLQRLTKDELVKLRDLENIQNNLGQQFSRIFQNLKNFGNIFQFQNDGKKSLAKQIITKEQTIQRMASKLGRQKKRITDLQNEIIRLNQLILQLGQRLKLKRAEQRDQLN